MTADRFLAVSSALATRANLPSGPGLGQDRYDAAGVDKIVLGRMLAQIAVVPMEGIGTITVATHDGDRDMLSALRGTLQGRTLRLDGTLPFKSSAAGHSFGSGTFIGGNATVTGMTMVNGRLVSGTIVSGSDTIILDGREIDLARTLKLVLVVPSTIDLAIRDLIGAVGITDDLDGRLDFAPTVQTHLVAAGITAFDGDLRGSGRATIAAVSGDTDIQVTGSGTCVLGSVTGTVNAKISGSGDVTIQSGTTRRLRAQVSGSGDIRHRGTVTGDAHLSVSGSGDVHLATVTGEVDHSVTGSGRITANGRTYHSRWH